MTERSARRAEQEGEMTGVDLIAQAVEAALDAKSADEGVEVAVYVVAQDGRRLSLVRRIKTAPNHTPIVEDGPLLAQHVEGR